MEGSQRPDLRLAGFGIAKVVRFVVGLAAVLMAKIGWLLVVLELRGRSGGGNLGVVELGFELVFLVIVTVFERNLVGASGMGCYFWSVQLVLALHLLPLTIEQAAPSHLAGFAIVLVAVKKIEHLRLAVGLIVVSELLVFGQQARMLVEVLKVMVGFVLVLK